MKIKVADFKNYKQCSKDLLELIKENYAISEDLEDVSSITKDGISYSLIEIHSSDWIGGGKYEDKTVTYQLVSFDEKIASYPCEANIFYYYDVILTQGISRTGSHYTDWYYEYEEPDMKLMYLEDVPEVIIPAHQEVKLKSL